MGFPAGVPDCRNYDPAHYEEALSSKRRYADEDIQAAARENLRIIGESEDAWR